MAHTLDRESGYGSRVCQMHFLNYIRKCEKKGSHYFFINGMVEEMDYMDYRAMEKTWWARIVRDQFAHSYILILLDWRSLKWATFTILTTNTKDGPFYGCTK